MIEVTIQENMIQEAKKLRSEMPSKPNNSITKGEGSYCGCLGEIILRNYLNTLKCDAKIASDYDFDIITNKGTKFEVKTKRCTSKPKESYECSVPDYNNRQKCDYYAFVRINEKTMKGYILGYLSKDEFLSKSVQRRKGETDNNILPNGKPFIFHADCKNIYINQLRKF